MKGYIGLSSKWLLLLLGFPPFFFFFFPEWLLIEKGALVEFSDRMSNTSLMAPGTACERQERFWSWECDLHATAKLSIRFMTNVTSDGEW